MYKKKTGIVGLMEFESYLAFGNAGILTPDQKIIVAGSVWTPDNDNIALARYDYNGTLDTTFNSKGLYGFSPGIVVTSCLKGNCSGTSLALQKDNKIVVVGNYFLAGDLPCFIVLRYNTDGSLDKSFGDSGYVIINPPQFYEASATGVAIQQDGNIIMVGNIAQVNQDFSGFIIARMLPNGQLDNSFGSKGSIIEFTAGVFSLLVGKTNTILVGGQAVNEENFFMASYLNNGTPDISFGDSGSVITPLNGVGIGIQAISLDNYGRIIAFGSYKNSSISFYFSNFIVGRYFANGTLDTSFNELSQEHPGFALANCGYDCSASAVSIEKDNKIVATGSFGRNNTLSQLLLTRFLNI